MASHVPAVTLPNGSKMPMVGLGTYQGRDDEMRRVLAWALECGYRHIDTAAVYQNEAEIGDVLHEWLSSGCIAREELFVVTKVRSSRSCGGTDTNVKSSYLIAPNFYPLYGSTVCFLRI
ncbi:aldo-keto reductase AKR2E4-like [Penaeus japonicus]|uniref:aldo-keto reductase AKR2E4-like n=1 Tax=Penaeus japonicus TaxID=27405 RepID=UPI001C715A64|nr:aldo-keto reductase AKR2E4-like [Penaeus japonicus]